LKIIFLDIDGVLNSARYYKSVDRSSEDWNRFDPKVVLALKKLIEEFSAKIVIASTWRFGAVDMLKKELTNSGLDKYLHTDWKTPLVHPSHRGTEIKMWLDKHPEVNTYLIFDDDTNILDEQLDYYIQTDIKFGLKEKHLQKAKQIFKVNKI
jgi:hypothetical protein